MTKTPRIASLALLTLSLAACARDATSPSTSMPDGALLSQGSANNSVGAVFTVSNQAGGNAVIAFSRASDGSLTPAGSFATLGNGTGAGLGSQGAVVLSEDGDFLFAVNAASNTITSFAVNGASLTRIGPWRQAAHCPSA